MESLIARQSEIISNITSIKTNFYKDSDYRKKPEYIASRLEKLDNLWAEFEQNHQEISTDKGKAANYFLDNVYHKGKDLYQSIRYALSSYGKESKSTQPDGKLDELLSVQRTNFRALHRLIKGINVQAISDKWELEDELKNIQAKWKVIDAQHLQIDHILVGGDISYEEEYSRHEVAYKNIKRELNKKISSTTHLEKSTPHLEIPTFSGNFSHWPTFYDLFTETIHNNNSITKAQKMQHLKGKLQGEAERLIYHLKISSENYDTAWEILLHRYNNTQSLFSNQFDIFLDQPIMQKQSYFEIKRLYDTTTECIHGITNLGVDTTTWDPMLVHLLCKKLDPETYTDYRESRKAPRELPELDELMTFLESKFTALEPRKSSKEPTTSFKRTPNTSKPNYYNKQNNYKCYNNKNNHQVVAQTSKCPVCNLNHIRNLFSCKKFMNMTPDVQLRIVNKTNICQNCLFSHDGSQCTSPKRCKICQADHHTILHEACTPSSKQATLSSPSMSTSSSKGRPNINHIAGDDEELLLTTVSLKVRSSDGDYVTLRALLDQGSQISLISENVVQRLGLRRERYNASVCGIGSGRKQSKGRVLIDCQSIYGDYHFTTEAVILSKVANCLPTIPFKKQSWPHLQHLQLADPEYNVSKSIDLLLDVSIYSQIIMDGLIKGPARAPIAQQTTLGWILSGTVRAFNCHIVTNDISNNDLSKYWEIEDVDTSSSPMTSEEKYCEEFYQKSTRRLSNGRYEVGIPMKPNYENQLGSSKSKAIAQFRQLERKMCNNSSFANSYKSFMFEYKQLGHMCIANNNDESKNAFYLPHHGVMKLDSTTTKLRVVFNASIKSSSGKSLNDFMCCGPNLQKDLMMLIFNWRTYKYVITADIEKMFRQIFIRKSDRHLQSIVWRQSPQEPIKDYHLTTVTYGTKSAPYLAMRTLKQLAIDDHDKYPRAASALKQSFYMDDLYIGENSVLATKELQCQLIDMLKGAGMNLRKWSSNEPQLLAGLSSDQLNSPFDFKCSETRKTLGLRWQPSTDSFIFINQLQHHKTGITKRQLLSEISKVFDPLGWLSPLSVRAKLLFQAAWTSCTSWDEEVPQSVQEEWFQLTNDFKTINQFIIPRYLGNTNQYYQIHAFCDASDKAYACVVYIVTKDNKGEYTSQLAIAKTKLAPLAKKVSLPRLELCGALLLSQLIQRVMECLSNQEVETHAWTDSMIVLGWINGDVHKWKQFVANRITKIVSIIPPTHWHHVRSEDNAADCATRGLRSSKLLTHPLWWQGPKWITNFNRDSVPAISYQSPDLEIKTVSVHAALHQNHISLTYELLHNHSSLSRIVNIVAWISRFISKARSKNTPGTAVLTSLERESALNIIIKDYQQHEFYEEIMAIKQKGHVHYRSKISSLNPFIDECGILRVGGRLKNAFISAASKHPIILSSHGRLTDLIIDQAHVTTLHGGPRLTLSYIRDRYWIISGIRTVKMKLRSCVKCRRFNQTQYHQIMADLPQPRVTPSRPFSHTGVDFTGHVELKANKGRGIKTVKGYIAVFVCMSTKAVHLELVSDLSTPAFLAALRRFSARRGSPGHIYCDNGRNFVGASRVTKKEYQDILSTINTQFINDINSMNIKWHFNAPAWPSAGGLWEAAVKSLKYHLKRVIGDQKLTYEEFSTLLHQIEACLNSRPLCQLTESPDDDILTPGHFLVGGPLLSRPQTDPNHMNISTRWQLVQSLNKHFWKRWSSEYLQQLQIRSKWRKPNRNFETDDVVLIKDENLPPGKWALGRVQSVHPGKDGYVRVATLKTCSSIIQRPVTKLVLLPVKEDIPKDEKSDQNHSSPISLLSSNPDEKTNKRQPRIKASYKNLFLSTFLLFFMLIAPSYPLNISNSDYYNLTSLEDNQTIYFDRISNIQYIKDEWRLVVYYNMTTYWRGLSEIKSYVNHINSLCITYVRLPFYSIIMQLQHEITEIEHYNTLLKYHGTERRKRGLVNGVGYIANSLFGVLDERFAEKYKNDIEQVSINENHLQNLIKNQTSILESELNIVRRNENIMNKQFFFINQRLQNISMELNRMRINDENELYITSSALAASIILSNIRWIQQTLIGTVTDISHGRIDSHLLSPEQLSHQLNIISSQINGKLTIPVDLKNIKDLYRLLKVSARVHSNYLIIEIKIPLLSNDMFELSKIIPVPQKRNARTYRLLPSIPYIAYNLRKDTAFLMSESDLQSCVHGPNDILLCSLNMPIYDLKIKQSICEIKVINQEQLCRSETLSSCEQQWIKLHRLNTWLYTCCSECHVRIICPHGIVMVELGGSAIITLGQGCTLKGDTFSIYAHNNYINQLNINHRIDVPEVSILNHIMKTTVPDNISEIEDHQRIWNQLRAQIDVVKEQSSSDMSIHDVHHYTVQYISVVAFIILGGVVVYLVRQRQAANGSSASPAPQGQEAAGAGPVSSPVTPVNIVPVQVSHLVESEAKCSEVFRVSGIDKATSIEISRSVHSLDNEE